MSFRGDSFYSYDTVIARHITHKGKEAIVLNDRHFSNTTSKHHSRVNAAIRDSSTPVFRFDEGMGARLDVTGKELFDYAVQRSADFLKLASKAKSRKGNYESAAANWLERAQSVNEFFNLRRKVDQNTIERLRASSEKADREADAKRKQAEAKRRIEQTEAFEAWKLGTGSAYEFDDALFPVAFRLEEDGAVLVSSKGARVPTEAARVALRFVLKHRESGWHRNGSTCQVGNYQLDAINSQGIVAGCHRITWEEVERVAAMLA